MFRILFSHFPAKWLPGWLFVCFAVTVPCAADFDIPGVFDSANQSWQNSERQAATKTIAVFKDTSDEPVDQESTSDVDSLSTSDVSDSSPGASVESLGSTSVCRCRSIFCDCAKRKAARKKISTGHKMLFYQNDLSYLKDPCYLDRRWNDAFKHFHVKGSKVETGGQTRFRYHHENNFRGFGITGDDDDFLLIRNRLYLDWQLTPNIRFFSEFLDANSSFENFSPRAIEENHADFLNLFMDATLWDDCRGKLTARIGRQELLYGAQRLVSPLDWANTRRTFDGYRLLWEGDDWNVDGFFVNPVAVDRRNFDDTNEDVDFYGIYATNKRLKNATLDVFWLALDNDLNGENSDTLGLRYNRDLANDNLLDFEGGYQFGDNADGSDRDAWYFTLGLGHRFKHRLKPTAWIYYDFADGGNSQGAGNGFDQLFPLAHKYLGFMDLFARSNIEDLNFLFTMQVSPRAKMLIWYHNFWLQSQTDTPYNVNGAAFAPGVTPVDDELGQELDLLLSLTITERTNLLLGYSHFFAGDYYDAAGLPVTGTDADFFYSQLQINF